MYQPYKNTLNAKTFVFYLDEYLTLSVTIENGTNTECVLNVGTTTYSWTGNSYSVNHTYLVTRKYNIDACCSNKLNRPQECSPTLSIDVDVKPIQMQNFSISLDKAVIGIGQGFILNMQFTSGTQMSCNITSPTANIDMRLTYSSLLKAKQDIGIWQKYSISLSTSIPSPLHIINVSCRNLLDTVFDNSSIEVQIPVSGLDIFTNGTVCFGNNLTVTWRLSQGNSVTITLLIDNIIQKSFNTSNKNGSLSITSATYNSTGIKYIQLTVSNRISSAKSSVKKFRVTSYVTNASVSYSFSNISNPAPFTPSTDVIPVSIPINFSVHVNPFHKGYTYDWDIDNGGFSLLTYFESNFTEASYIFNQSGTYSLKVKINGCNTSGYFVTKIFSVVNPIEDFNVSITPYPVGLANSSVTFTIWSTDYVDCMDIDFGDGSKTETLSHSWVSCDVAEKRTHPIQKQFTESHQYRNRGNYIAKVRAVNKLHMKRKFMHVTIKACYSPSIVGLGKFHI